MSAEIELLKQRLEFAEWEWVRATDGMKERDAEIERLRKQLASARKALEFIRDGYERGDINHVDFRVGACKAALDALTDDQQRTGDDK